MRSGHIEIVKIDDNNLVLRMAEPTFFDTGSAYIKPESEEILRQLSVVLNDFSSEINMIRIEGHTDNRPINTRQFESNWELSTARAVNILKWLVAYMDSIEPRKFSAVGYSEYHPVALNDTAEGRAKNRRVDFVVEMMRYQP